MIICVCVHRIYSLDLAAIKYERRSRRKPSGLSRISTISPKSCRGIDLDTSANSSEGLPPTCTIQLKEAITQRKHSSSSIFWRSSESHPCKKRPTLNKRSKGLNAADCSQQLFILECISNLSERVHSRTFQFCELIYLF